VRRLVAAWPALPVPVDLPEGDTGGLHTRAFVKAQEGCNDVCAFCIVPRTRGRERSLDPHAVAAVVREREAAGAREVVITGTQLGAYGRDLDPHRYGPAALIRTLLDETSAPRIRFSSLQPQDITPELLSLWDDPRLCRHFHLALQSGSEGVLRRMRRRYSLAQYRDALAAIRSIGDDVAVTTDVITGFPGESEAEHAESLAFCRAAGFAQMHVFPYSRRPGTSAHLLSGHLPPSEARARLDAMLAVARDAARDFRTRHLGRALPVLWEESKPDSDGDPVWEGLTDNYLRVRCRSAANLRNAILPVRIVGEDGDALVGALPAARTP
jgi:threonylcarbamoyladenosine tRNA methylthiotransferase MtaB